MKHVYSLCTAWAAIMLMAFSSHAQSTIYVRSNATGANNGSSWANAFTDLQSALDAAVSGDQIWVTAWTYYPTKDITGSTAPADNRKKSFVLKNGVKLYGGFNGTETTLDQRNPAGNLTTLSGDLDRNDGNDTFGHNSNNAYHVVTAYGFNTSTVLDGFTIKAGNANVTQDFMGGVTSGDQYGGGMLVYLVGSNLSIANCVFAFNYSGFGGAGMYFDDGIPDIRNSVFYFNYTHGDGGGLFIDLNTHGAKIINSVFADNHSDNKAGGLFNFGSSNNLINCTFAGNSAGVDGGAIHNNPATYPVIANTIVWYNTVSNSTGSKTISGGDDSHASLVNCAIEVIPPFGDPFFDNVNDPDGPDGLWRTADDGLAIRFGSAAINAGKNTAVPAEVTTDIIGDARFQGNVNIGAYETLKAPKRWYVSPEATGNHTGTSWANAFNDLQSAIDAAYNGDEIWVAKGNYVPTKDYYGNWPEDLRRTTFALHNSVKLYGGFAGTETSTSERNIAQNPTFLSGDWNGDDTDDISVNKSDNCYNVVAATSLYASTVLDGFTITGGYADLTEEFIGVPWGRHEGGGLLVNNGNSLTINQCVFRSNFAGFGGGAIYFNNSSAKVTNTVFDNNFCSNSYGGAVCTYYSSPSFTNCAFVGNNSNFQGGAMFIFGSSVTITNSSFADNHSTYEGGAIHTQSGSATIKNSIIWHNTGKQDLGLASSSINVSYSSVEGGFAGTGNSSEDPKFLNYADGDGLDNRWFTSDDGLVLLTGSPALDAGSNAVIPVGINTDLIGDNRIMNGTVAMGAYERDVLGAEVTLTIPGESFTYDGTPRYATATTNPANLNVIIRYKKDNHYVDALLDAGTYQVSATIASAIYSGTAVKTVTILKAPLTINFLNTTQTYTGEPLEVQVQTEPVTLPVIMDYEQNDQEAVPQYPGTYTVYAWIDDPNYEADTQTTFVIEKAPATLTLSNLSQTYDGTVKSVSLTTGPEDLDGVTITYLQNETEVEPVNAGTYTVDVSVDNPNYSGHLTQDLVINKKDQTISFDALSGKMYGDAPFGLTATASSGLPVSFVSSDPSVATVEGNEVTILGGGTVTISAVQEGNNNYAPAQAVAQTLVIGKLSQTIHFETIHSATIGDAPVTVSATASSALPVTFTSSDPSVVRVDGTSLIFVGSGTATITASQEGNNFYSAAPGVEQTITVSKKAQAIVFGALPEKIFGEASFTLDAASSSGLPVSYSSSNEAVATIEGNVVTLHGQGETVITATQAGNNQFAAAEPASQTLVVKLVTGTESTSNVLVQIYPNPATEYILVESAAPHNAYVLMNADGKEMSSATFAGSDDTAFRIDVRDLATGVYYLRVSQGINSLTTRIVKK